MNGSVTGLLEIGNVDGESVAALLGVVGERTAGDYRRVLIAIQRLRHTERLKNIGGGKFRKRLAADALHDNRQKEESRVAVKPLAARFEVQIFLANNHAERVFVGGDAINVDACEFKQCEIIAKAARVVQQIQQRDLVAVIGQFWNVFVNVVVHGECSLLLEKQDAPRGALFLSGAHSRYH